MTIAGTTLAESPAAKPMFSGRRSTGQQALVYLFVVVPFIAAVAAIPFAWGWGLSWLDVILAVIFYLISCSGITVGYHRFFTHGAFKATRALKISLAIAGSMAIEGPVIRWVADHRRHHAFSDRDGDPHSPWRFGNSVLGLMRGFFHAHVGWLFRLEQTNEAKYAPDLSADPDLIRVDRHFPTWVAVTMLAPAAIALAVTGGSTQAAVSAFFWASLVRVAVLHHVTWSINSVCHMIGDRPYASRDRSANFWPLAVVSLGESWHNSHHADPTCARHGVDRGQLDVSARIIRMFEIFGWAREVRWPKRDRFDKLAARRVVEDNAAG